MNVLDLKGKHVVLNERIVARVDEVSDYGIDLQVLIAGRIDEVSSGDRVHYSWHKIKSIKEVL